MYADLLYCEDRRTHQRHPNHRTISDAAHLTVSTAIKHIIKLVDRQLITAERAGYTDHKGMKWNSNNLYTILPVQTAMSHCCQQQMLWSTA